MTPNDGFITWREVQETVGLALCLIIPFAILALLCMAVAEAAQNPGGTWAHVFAWLREVLR